jgi:pseudaminic acid synthase
MKPEIQIDGRKIGSNNRPYVIAEISANHNGSIENAIAIMQAAKQAGADAIKLQTYTADTITINHKSNEFLLNDGPWAGKTLYELYEWAHTPWDWHRELFQKGKELGLTVFSSPFDKTAVDFLENFNPPAYKIASFELIDLPLIEYVAKTGKPMIMSTGMASKDEIIDAVESAKKGGCKEICLLHCTSGYPTPVSEADLKTIPEISKQFSLVTGLSDHTLGTTVSVASVALGASVIEKHVILNRTHGGPDADFSLEPKELELLINDVNIAWDSLGTIRSKQQESELTQKPLRRSIYVVADIKKGEVFSDKNIRSIRPGFGLPPKKLPMIIGLTASKNINRGTALQEEHISF